MAHSNERTNNRGEVHCYLERGSIVRRPPSKAELCSPYKLLSHSASYSPRRLHSRGDRENIRRSANDAVRWRMNQTILDLDDLASYKMMSKGCHGNRPEQDTGVVTKATAAQKNVPKLKLTKFNDILSLRQQGNQDTVREREAKTRAGLTLFGSRLGNPKSVDIFTSNLKKYGNFSSNDATLKTKCSPRRSDSWRADNIVTEHDRRAAGTSLEDAENGHHFEVSIIKSYGRIEGCPLPDLSPATEISEQNKADMNLTVRKHSATKKKTEKNSTKLPAIKTKPSDLPADTDSDTDLIDWMESSEITSQKSTVDVVNHNVHKPSSQGHNAPKDYTYWLPEHQQV